MKLVLSGNRYVQIPQLNSMLFCLKFIQDEHEPMSGQGPPLFISHESIRKPEFIF